MLFKVILVGLCFTATAAAAETNSTAVEEADVNNGTEVEGRSLFSDLPRQGRIMNDDKISIKGFIPIVGVGEDAAKDQNKPSHQQQQPQIDAAFIEKYMKNMGALMGQDGKGQLADDVSQFPQHVAQPEDQRRFISSALQGILGNVNSVRKPFLGRPQVNRKSDCVCVPFYLCKNGYLTTEPSSSELYPMYHQRKQEDSYGTASSDSFLPINERSNDGFGNINNTKFTEEILGRMIGGKSINDGCGLLRTCCQRSNPMQMLPNFDFGPGAQDVILTPEMISPMYTKPSHQGISQMYPPQYKPPTRPGYQRPPPPQSNGYYPTVRPNYGRPQYRPPKLIHAPASFEPMMDTHLPVPSHNTPQFASHIAQFAYDKCGSRQSVGINGRVQNLNYHESSTEFGEFPWQVAILKRLGPSDNLYACGGALISSSYILTAAHCIKKFQADDLKVRLGEWDVHREDEFYPYIEKNIVEIAIHPHFSPRNLANDVAVLKLDSEIDFNQHPHISPICMADPFEVFTGHRCYVAGWGKNSFGQQGEYQSVLMKVDLPVLDTRICENLLKRTKLGWQFRLDRSMICAGGEHGKDACEGDGGSGLVCDVNGTWKVVGLVSWGLGCGQASVPGVYTNVGFVRPWVDKVVFPFYSNLMAAKSTNAANNFNELINERSFGNDNNNTLEVTTTTASANTTNL